MDKLIEIQRQKMQILAKIDTCKKLLSVLETQENVLLKQIDPGELDSELSKYFTRL